MYDRRAHYHQDPEERERHETARALLTVLRHKAILDAVDLERLADLAENAKSERLRLRAAQALQKARQDATRTLADLEGVREETLRDKGLAKSTTHHVHSLDVTGLPMEKLRQLASGTEHQEDERTLTAEIEEVRPQSTDEDTERPSGAADPA